MKKKNNKLLNKKLCLCTIALFLSSGIFIPFVSADETLATPQDSHEITTLEDQQPINSSFAWINISLVILPRYSKISGLFIPQRDDEYKDGKYNVLIIGLEWTRAWSTINRITSIIPFLTIPPFKGVTNGEIGIFIGKFIKATLSGATDYQFKGLVFFLNIP